MSEGGNSFLRLRELMMIFCFSRNVLNDSTNTRKFRAKWPVPWNHIPTREEIEILPGKGRVLGSRRNCTLFTSLNCHHLAERNVGWVAPARGTQVGRFPLFLRNVLMVRILERRKGTTSGDNEHPVTGNNQVETVLSGVLKRVLFYVGSYTWTFLKSWDW